MEQSISGGSENSWGGGEGGRHSTGDLLAMLWASRVQQMIDFVREVKAEDFAGLATPLDEKTQLKHHHRPRKHKGGHPPKDYTAVETFVDLKRCLEKREYIEALPLYYYLKRLLGR